MVSLRPLAALPIVGVVADGRTYRHLLYLLVTVPLWFVYTVIAPFGIALGIALSVVFVGIGVLIGAVIASRLLAGFERRLANRLLGTDLAKPDDVPSDATGAVETVRSYLDAPSTWRGLGFVSLKFWVSLLAFVPISVLGRSLLLVAAPVRYPFESQFGELNGEPVVWAIDTAPRAALAVGVGVVGVLVGLHLTNLTAGGARLMAVALLGETDATEAEPDAEGETVDDAGSVDAPSGGEGNGPSGGVADADGFRFDADPADPDGAEGDDRADADGSADRD